MIQVGFLLLLCIAVMTAAAPAPPAPTPPAKTPPAPVGSTNPDCVDTFKAATNFDLQQFSNTWYEVREIPPGDDEKCEAATYKANPDNTISVTRVWVDSSGKPQKLSGTAKTSGPKPTDGLLTVTFGQTSTKYTIFFIDYKSVFGVYACINKKAFIFAFAKTETVDDAALKDINSAITAAGLKPSLLAPSPRSGCPATY